MVPGGGDNQTHDPQDRCHLIRNSELIEEARDTLALPRKAAATDAPETWEQGTGCIQVDVFLRPKVGAILRYQARKAESALRARVPVLCARGASWRAQDVSALARGVQQEALEVRLHLLAGPQSPPPGIGSAVPALEKTHLGGDLGARCSRSLPQALRTSQPLSLAPPPSGRLGGSDLRPGRGVRCSVREGASANCPGRLRRSLARSRATRPGGDPIGGLGARRPLREVGRRA